MTHWAHREIQAANCHGTLAIGGTTLSCPAWAVLNVASLWAPAPTRGANRFVPHSAGTVALPRRRHEAQRTLEMVIVGTCDFDGDPYADPYEGLEANVDYLNDNVFSYADTMTSLLGSLTMPSGVTRTAQVQIERVEFGVGSSVALTATVDITIPQGHFAA